MPEKTRKTGKVKKIEEKPPLNRKLLAVSIILAIIIIMGALLYQFFWRTQEVKFPLKAAIVDQLGESIQNPYFKKNVTDLLVNQNFTVVYNSSEEVTVNFFKKLPKSNCGLYILRVHSAVRNNTDLIDFFTCELYRENMYDEYGDRLSVGWYQWEPDKKYFAIGPGFVEVMDGTFPKSIIIAMGCKSLKYPTMAQAFLINGAQLYIGWTDDVDANDSDNLTFRLMELLFKYNKTISEAIEECNRVPRQYWQSKLDYFPKNIGDERMSEIIYTSTPQTFNTLNPKNQVFIAITIRRIICLKGAD
jgi:flagellar basal body-associated protein FliL